jgi:hypothetical protein
MNMRWQLIKVRKRPLTSSATMRTMQSPSYGLATLLRPQVFSAGIDLGLCLAREIEGREQAKVIQLFIEYDPQLSFNSGHAPKASKKARQPAKKMVDEAMPKDQKRLINKIVWRRLIDTIHTRK